MHYFIFEPVAGGPAHARRTHPALLPEYAQRLGNRVLRSAEHRSEVPDANAGRTVQNEQYLEPVGIREQVESLGPACGVNVGQRRRRALDLRLVARLDHGSNLAQPCDLGTCVGAPSLTLDPGYGTASPERRFAWTTITTRLTAPAE